MSKVIRTELIIKNCGECRFKYYVHLRFSEPKVLCSKLLNDSSSNCVPIIPILSQILPNCPLEDYGK